MVPSTAARSLWGKTGAGSRDRRLPREAWHPLIAHMIDSAEMAGWLWDHFLSPGVRCLLAGALPHAEGRRRYRWLAGLHDLGKACPGFQAKSPERAPFIRSAGLPLVDHPHALHAFVSAWALFGLLRTQGWGVPEAEWAALILGGHHGVFPAINWREQRPDPGQLGDGPWENVRGEITAALNAHVGVQAEMLRAEPPGLAAQLVLSGAVILADWLASTESLFPYANRFPEGYPALSAAKTPGAREVIGLRDAWRPDDEAVTKGVEHLFPLRFEGNDPRAVQQAAYELAAKAGGPGLLVIEAPMGEGKTEAALTAAEVLGAKTGANGIFVGLPTQATANQMFGRVTRWLGPQAGTTTVTLAHGKARRYEEYRRLLPSGVGEDEDAAVAASQWLVGGKRALLSPVVVGTIDQLLLAGVASRHVALRHLGLAGKVVILDEIHAVDAYMSVILRRVLAWLGAARVPVVLLSATLPPRSRAELLAAYAGERVDTADMAGYPLLSWCAAPQEAGERPDDDVPPWEQASGPPPPVRPLTATTSARRDQTARVELLTERDERDVAPLVADLIAGGGCALVIRNTVGRAQRTYAALVDALGADAVTLAHARFTAADRRERDQGLVDRFGPDGDRPPRHVVVATQVAEQSLDVDFDVLVSDLAPIDLLLQRLGRTHRHPGRDRPPRLAEPRLIVVGQEPTPDTPPRLPPGSRAVYGEHLLWRTAAVLLDRTRISLPGDIAELVEAVYGDRPIGPDGWQTALAAARDEAERTRERDEHEAKDILLPSPWEAPSLAALHAKNQGDAVEEATPAVQAHVRLGPPTLEVLLLRASGDPEQALTVSAGTPSTVPLNGPVPGDLVDTVLDQAIRLPAQLTEAADAEAHRPEAWQGSLWLDRAPVLLLPADGLPLRLGPYTCSYSPTTGLEVSRA